MSMQLYFDYIKMSYVFDDNVIDHVTDNSVPDIQATTQYRYMTDNYICNNIATDMSNNYNNYATNYYTIAWIVDQI